jgi:hypothetical protein
VWLCNFTRHSRPPQRPPTKASHYSVLSIQLHLHSDSKYSPSPSKSLLMGQCMFDRLQVERFWSRQALHLFMIDNTTGIKGRCLGLNWLYLRCQAWIYALLGMPLGASLHQCILEHKCLSLSSPSWLISCWQSHLPNQSRLFLNKQGSRAGLDNLIFYNLLIPKKLTDEAWVVESCWVCDWTIPK